MNDETRQALWMRANDMFARSYQDPRSETNAGAAASAIRAALQAYEESEKRVKALESEKDAAYSERNQLVALLAQIYPSGLRRSEIPGWDPEWHGCLYVHTPAGQLSWHYHDREAHLFDGLPPYPNIWDGHTTAEKYERVRALIERLRSAESKKWQDDLWYAR